SSSRCGASASPRRCPRSWSSSRRQLQIQRPRGPGVQRGIADLLPRKARGGPVGSALAHVEHRRLLEGEHLLELAQVVCNADARLDRVGFHYVLQDDRAIHELQPEDPYHRLARELHQRGRIALALAEGRACLGVEAEHALAADRRRLALERFERLDQPHLALVAPDRQLRHFFVRDGHCKFHGRRSLAQCGPAHRACAGGRVSCPMPPVATRRALIAAPYLRVLRKAAEITGGEKALAAALAVAQDTVRSWLDGEVVPPVHFYVAALEIVEHSEGK